MSKKKSYTEKNIQKLIDSSLKTEYRLDIQHKETVLDLLLQKMEQQKKETLPMSASVIGLSIMWIVAVILVFTELKDSLFMLDLIKVALSFSLFLIPVSSIVIVILKLKTHEPPM